LQDNNAKTQDELENMWTEITAYVDFISASAYKKIFSRIA
jgi:hypothetical protein